MNGAALLTLHGIEKTFHPGTANEVRALRGIDLEVAAGSYVVVIGSNGSGKSTLLGAMAGSVAVDAGEIRLAGQEITTWPEHARARLVGRVFQSPFLGTAPELTVAENLALAARRGERRGLGALLPASLRAELRARVEGLRMGLEDRLDQAIGSLSGGQRQALTLLMATWRRPELLLLDEHTAALDPRSAAEVIRLTEAVIREQGLTAVMVTHSMSQAASLGDRLLMMAGGRIVHDWSGEEKRRRRPEDLLHLFEEIRREEEGGPPG